MLLVFSDIQMTCAFLLAILFFTHTVRIWHITDAFLRRGTRAQPLADPHIRALLPALVVQKTSLTLSP